MRPRIGVTTSFELGGSPEKLRTLLNAAYSDAIYAAGGIPVPIAAPSDAGEDLVREIVSEFDALLFTGGPDLDPKHYGQTRHEKTQVLHARRDAFDIAAFRAADAADLPILSICLGCQIANVARGGCLIQHVDDAPRPTPIQHHKPDNSSAFHTVRIEAGSLLASIIGQPDIEVNSRHHQTVDASQVGGRLRAVAFAPDGVVEAVEDGSPGRFLIAVQWHPEDLIDRPEHLALFKALVNAVGLRIPY